ncbi:MAG: pilus assembly protein PilM [Proteobacteria bacterium]|nr:pilus assembly protein PilM [Pseudomonadota bacterium]
MPMMKNVLGLDVGSHTVKAVELRQTFSDLEPVQLRVHPRVDPTAELPELLRRFIKMHRLPTEHAVCAIPGDRVSTRRLEFPFRDRRKLDQAVPFEVEGAIPFDLEEVVVDWELVGGERNHAEVVATVAPREVVAELLGDLREADCEPRTLEAEGLALANLAALFSLPGSRLLVDLGHRKTTLCLLDEGQPRATRTVPLGGRHLTEAIAKDRDWSPEDAETAKCEEGVFHLGYESASPSAVTVLDRLAREILRTLESLEPVLGGPAERQLAAITLLGGTARLNRIEEFLSERTGVPASRLAYPPEATGQALVASGDPLIFAPAIALALRGTAKARTRTDFRQDEFAYRASLKRVFGPELRHTATLGAVAAGLLAAGAITALTLESNRAEALEAEAATIFAEAFPGEPIAGNPLRAMSDKVADAQRRADFLGVYSGNLSALDLLTLISKQVPTELEVTFDEVNIDGRLIKIKVFARGFESADLLRAKLAEVPTLAQPRVGEIRKDPRRNGVNFELTISLAGGDDDRG